MSIPYDVFNDIIALADIQTIINLYNTDKTIRQLCLNYKFTKVLLDFRFNQYFNPQAKSSILDDFLNDIADPAMLKELQLSFGACLYGKNILKKIIVLNGRSNGKSTFLTLLRRILGYKYTYGSSIENPENYRDAYILNYMTHNLNIPHLKYLSGGETIYCKHDSYDPKFILVLETNDPLIIASTNSLQNRLKIFTFKTTYTNNIQGINEKIKIPYMDNKLSADKNTLSALLNFLLQGCREVLKK